MRTGVKGQLRPRSIATEGQSRPQVKRVMPSSDERLTMTIRLLCTARRAQHEINNKKNN